MKNVLQGFTMTAALMAASLAQADPVLECSQGVSSNVEVGNCLAGVEAGVEATVLQVLGYAMNSAKELDDVTGRAVAVIALQSGQAAWATYRDQHCEFVGATYGGGSGTGAAIRGCRIDLGRARVSVLLGFSQ